MPEHLKKALARLGLKDNELRIYVACLDEPRGLFVSELAKATGIKRSTVNITLDRLVERGFVTHHLDGARKLFRAESPETLLFRLEESLGDFRALIPLLYATAGRDKHTKVRFFEGKAGVEKILS